MNINSTNDKEIALKSYTETFLDILRQELGVMFVVPIVMWPIFEISLISKFAKKFL